MTGSDEIGLSLGYGAAQYPAGFSGAARAGVAIKGFFELGFGIGRHTVEADRYGFEKHVSTRDLDLALYHHLGARDREPRVRDSGARLGLSSSWGDGTHGTAVSLALYRVESSRRNLLVMASVGVGIINPDPGDSYRFLSGELLVGVRLTRQTTILIGPAVALMHKELVYGGSIGLATCVRANGGR